MVMHPLYVIFIIRMPQEKAITISIAAVNGVIHGIMICVLTAAISA